MRLLTWGRGSFTVGDKTRLDRWFAEVRAIPASGDDFPFVELSVEREIQWDAYEAYYPTDSDYYTLAIGWRWKFGMSHAYYDGPHHGLHLGIVHVEWSPRWCERCHKGECP